MREGASAGSRGGPELGWREIPRMSNLTTGGAFHCRFLQLDLEMFQKEGETQLGVRGWIASTRRDLGISRIARGGNCALAEGELWTLSGLSYGSACCNHIYLYNPLPDKPLLSYNDYNT